MYRITGAQQAHSDDQEQRIGKYLVSMLIRTLCVILALVVPGPLRWVFAAGAVFLPYIAVVMANAGGSRRSAPPPTVFTHSPRAGLSSSSASTPPAPEEPLEGTVVTDGPTPPTAGTAGRDDARHDADRDVQPPHRTVA